MSLLDRVAGLFAGVRGSAVPEAIPAPALLFVDPDQNLLDGHRRMLHSLRPDWTARYVTDGPGALAELAASPADVLVTEIDLPCRDGTDLLASVQKLFPAVVRIVLSSETDAGADAILRATQSAHQFLAKPCPAEVLISRIEHAVSLRLLLRRPELTRIVSGLPHLPSLPPVYLELVRALSTDRASMNEIGDILARDVAMTSRVLHLVNSAFFGLPRKVTSPREAAVLLGVNTLKSLVLYVRLFFSAPDSKLPGFGLDELWTHCSLTGRLSREIARAEGTDSRTQEQAYLAGILHDIGKLLVLEAPRYLGRLESDLWAGESLADIEYREFGTSHAEIGAYLLGLWGFPDAVVEAVALHHRPQQIFQDAFSVVTAVTVANAILDAGQGKPPAIDPGYLSGIGASHRLAAWRELAAPILAKAEARTLTPATPTTEGPRT